MNKTQLQILLSQLDTLQNTRPSLEQYQTPADIAADVLALANLHLPLEEKTILDLGTGNGIFAIGAALYDARAYGVDIDENAIQLARENAEKAAALSGKELSVTFSHQDIEDVERSADAVVMNPPFGVQVKDQNLPFLEAAFRCAPICFALLHHSEKKEQETQRFYTAFARKHNCATHILKTYRFSLAQTFSFHTKSKKYILVDLYLFNRIE